MKIKVTHDFKDAEKELRLRKKGEVYEKKLFTAKEERFKSNSFLDEVSCKRGKRKERR